MQVWHAWYECDIELKIFKMVGLVDLESMAFVNLEGLILVSDSPFPTVLRVITASPKLLL